MENKLSIDNIKKCFDVLIASGIATAEIVNLPKESTWFDKLKPIAGVLDDLYALIGTDFKAIIPEIKDLDSLELEELKLYFEEKFDIPQDDIEKKIESMIGLVIKISQLIPEIIEVIKNFKNK